MKDRRDHYNNDGMDPDWHPSSAGVSAGWVDGANDPDAALNAARDALTGGTLVKASAESHSRAAAACGATGRTP